MPRRPHRQFLKPRIYGWQGHRAGFGDTREIMAAQSKAEVARALGFSRPSQVFNLCETSNKLEIEEALREQGSIFVREMNARFSTPWSKIDRKDLDEPAPERVPTPMMQPATIYAIREDWRGEDRYELQVFSAAGTLSSNGTFTASERTGLAFGCLKRFDEGSYHLSPEAAREHFHSELRAEIASTEERLAELRARLEAPINMNPKPTR